MVVRPAASSARSPRRSRVCARRLRAADHDPGSPPLDSPRPSPPSRSGIGWPGSVRIRSHPIRRGPFPREAGPVRRQRINHDIRLTPIRLIDQNNEQVGVVETAVAMRMAQEAGLDLVEIQPDVRPPVCRIMDYGK
ncbi:MAG TPA: hypothetical protein DEB06_11320, partial [Phycisphaerales bacterium]|nr:hypothetical protein [Phycisphaerales bacterium]